MQLYYYCIITQLSYYLIYIDVKNTKNNTIIRFYMDRYNFYIILLLLYLRWRYFFVWNITCCQANFHSSLPMSQHFKLRQGHFVGHAHRVRSLIPLIPDVSHRITNWGNHKCTPLTFRPVFGARDPPITCRARARQNIEWGI